MVRVIREGDTWEFVSQPPRSALLLTTTMSSKTDDNENDPQNPDTAQTLFLPHDPCFSPYLCNPPATPLRSLLPQLFDTFNCLIPPLQPYQHPTCQYLRRRMVQGSVFSPRSLYARKLDELDNSNFFSNGKGAILHDDDYHSASSESSRSTLDS